MSNIKNFISQYEQILTLIEHEGFSGAAIFKGFSSKEKNNLNFLVEDKLVSNAESKSLLTRLSNLKKELMKLLNCKIIISTPQSMDPYYLRKLNDTNSVKLQRADTTLAQLIEVFGEDWIFNPSDNTNIFWQNVPKDATYLNLEQKIPNDEILPSLKTFNLELASTSPEKREANLRYLAESLRELGYNIDISNIEMQNTKTPS